MRRHENRSTMMTSNRPLEDWAKLIGDAPATTAILDRFLQHTTIINITGKSYRLRHPAVSLSNPGGKTEADTPPAAATDSDTTKPTRGRRSTGDGEGLSPRKTPLTESQYLLLLGFPRQEHSLRQSTKEIRFEKHHWVQVYRTWWGTSRHDCVLRNDIYGYVPCQRLPAPLPPPRFDSLGNTSF
jgi:hypothetical protein